MDDQDLDCERRAQDGVKTVIARLRAEPNMARIEAAMLLRRASNLTELRRRAILDFAAALLDEEFELETIISDSGLATKDWDEEISAARRSS